MTSIFDKFSDLDPARQRRQIETAHGSPVFDVFSCDDARAEAQMKAAFSPSFDPFSRLDPRRERDQIDAVIGGGGGGGDYIVTGAQFDGSNAFLALSNSTIPDSSVVSYSVFIRVGDYLDAVEASGAGNRSIIVDATNYNFNLDLRTFVGVSRPRIIHGPVFAFIEDVNNPTSDCGTLNSTDYIDDGTAWVWYAGKLDTGHPTDEKIAQQIANGVNILDLVSDTTAGSFLMNFNGVTIGVPDANDAPYYTGPLAEFWFAPGQDIDWSDPTVQAKFRDPVTGKPVNLGADGSVPTGIAPAVFFSKNNQDTIPFSVNRGGRRVHASGGALPDATTSPSD